MVPAAGSVEVWFAVEFESIIVEVRQVAYRHFVIRDAEPSFLEYPELLPVGSCGR
jgi:hypothetical protein